MAKHDIIVMGASRGGVAALSQLVSYFERDFPASVFIVQHVSPRRNPEMDKILSRAGALEARYPENGEKISPGKIYLAPPNRHLLVKTDRVAVTMGPRENRMRPSIDVLFRSTAASLSTRVVAVLLTGYLDDGVSGLLAVQRCGGITIVQDPAEAHTPDLPRTAIQHVQVDHVLPIKRIAQEIIRLATQPAALPFSIPDDILNEVKISEHNVPDMDEMEKVGLLSSFTCPECGGVSWQLENEPILRFRCHTGHAFSAKSYFDGQSEIIEYSLWAVVQHLQERTKLLKKMAADERQKGNLHIAQDYEKKAQDLVYHSKVIRNFITAETMAS